MSIRNFVPEVWNANLLVALRKTLIFGSPAIINRDYEGDIAAAGDTVRVTSVGRPNIVDYVPGVTKLTPEALNTGQRTLVVDQAKAFAFEVDDVDARQALGTFMNEAGEEAGFGLADIIDQYIANLYTEIPASQRLPEVQIPGGEASSEADVRKVYDQIFVPLRVRLDEMNVPRTGRYITIPPWIEGAVSRDPRFVEADKSANASTLRTGEIGRAAGFSIFLTNNCPEPVEGTNVIQAGTPRGITFADQINKTEAYRPESSFADAVKGLSLYGAKLMRPDVMVMATATRLGDATP
jgi:N4-gp56 family major capsid protein